MTGQPHSNKEKGVEHEDDLDDDLDQEGEDDEEQEDDEPYCHTCSGTGEGMYDGSSCSACRGKGY